MLKINTAARKRTAVFIPQRYVFCTINPKPTPRFLGFCSLKRLMRNH